MNFIQTMVWVILVAVSAFSLGRHYPTINRQEIIKIEKELICLEARTSEKACQTIVKKYE